MIASLMESLSRCDVPNWVLVLYTLIVYSHGRLAEKYVDMTAKKKPRAAGEEG